MGGVGGGKGRVEEIKGSLRAQLPLLEVNCHCLVKRSLRSQGGKKGYIKTVGLTAKGKAPDLMDKIRPLAPGSTTVS